MMLAVHLSGGIIKCQTYLGNCCSLEGSLCQLNRVHSLNATANHSHQEVQFSNVALGSSSSWKDCSKLIPHIVPHRFATKTWLCRSHSCNSSDEEYRSSRNIAISLFRRYRNFIDRGGGDNLKEFIHAGVNAYALGCTDEGLRKELNAIRESGIEIEAMRTYGGSTGLKSKIFREEVDECIFWLSIIFITILCTPQPTIVRWSSAPPVSDEALVEWKGFCQLIANAYYIRGMAWLPVKTLQLEQMAVVGRAEEPSVVASRMRLVFSTLEVGEVTQRFDLSNLQLASSLKQGLLSMVVSPQWPRV